MSVITRRELFRAAAFAPLLGSRLSVTAFQAPAGLSLGSVKAGTRLRAVGPEGKTVAGLETRSGWTDGRCRSSITNNTGRPIQIREIVLVDLQHGLPPDTRLYGEGFQMLTQTGGTLGAPADLGNYTDEKHYRLPQPEGTRVVYGLATFSGGQAPHHLLAFTSSRRFSGAIHIRPESLQLVLDCEGLALHHRETWELEDFIYSAGSDRDALLDDLATRLVESHPPLRSSAPPAGWCSWYCFGPRVTAQQVLDNLDVIAKQIPGLKYIQIDDGYQPAMGDWLETGAAFGGDVQSVLKQIRQRGFEPAIWVAPFVAEAGSSLFKQHPEWFVKDQDGTPLRSDKVTFGGWRRGPWYALDGTHPEAQEHLERVFRTMREEWGCTYFKLDANFWGAIHGGRFHDSRATRVEAYRRGMRAVLKGTADAFVLGCNHPIWASMGLIHGSRSSHDIKRDWKRISDTARQNLMRNWQNGRLWWNDPDAVVLTGTLPENEFRFHATAIFATGGMILSGDDLTTISAARLEMLRKLEPPTGLAATFADDSLQVGVVELKHRRAFCVFNWGEAPQTVSFSLSRAHTVRELWTNEDLGRRDGLVSVRLDARDGRVFTATPA